jgi:hypothetical protein
VRRGGQEDGLMAAREGDVEVGDERVHKVGARERQRELRAERQVCDRRSRDVDLQDLVRPRADLVRVDDVDERLEEGLERAQVRGIRWVGGTRSAGRSGGRSARAGGEGALRGRAERDGMGMGALDGQRWGADAPHRARSARLTIRLMGDMSKP